MRRTRRDEGGLGDWSSTGTFLRKPANGWLHEDHELQDQSSINYKIWYLGCIEVCQSMRTLQYNMRTQVTKEAIARMAEAAGKLQQHKKRKAPKQLTRLLGAADTRWAGEVNLAISAESLRISNVTSNREIMNHSLPSISFASGGDGPTLDFIGYVAKDPVHERACHVFECVECSQYVLTTIGQAFELRYKMYLNSPHPEPLQIRDSIGTGDSWAQVEDLSGEERGAGGEHCSPTPSGGIYSDLPEFPTEALPSPSTPETILPPLTTVSGARPRVYSRLPGFPTVPEGEEGPLTNGTGAHPRHSRLDNPYDTIHTSPPSPPPSHHHRPHKPPTLTPSPSGVYSEPGEITSSYEESYSTQMMTIKQLPATSVNSELIDLTPPLEHPHHLYSNTGSGVENGFAAASASKQSPVPKPRPLPRPRAAKKPVAASSSVSEAVYDNPSFPAARGRSQEDLHGNDYDDPDALHHCPAGRPMRPTSDCLYDDIQDVIASKPKKRSSPPLVPKSARRSLPPVAPKGGQSAGGQKFPPRGPVNGERRERPPAVPPPLYDDPNSIIMPNGVGDRYQNQTPPKTRTPKFDDTIYAIRHDIGLEEEEEDGARGATGDMGSLQQPLPGPLDPLPTQHYFHGRISRVEAEGLLEIEGEFLVRESTKITGQFVLTGMAHSEPQHLLLMDKTGKVKSRDHEFDSVPHLVDYFTSRDIPLMIGKSQVFLRRAVVNAGGAQ